MFVDCTTPRIKLGASTMQSMVATIYTLLVIVMGSPSYSEAQADDSKLISCCYTTGHIIVVVLQTLRKVDMSDV